MERKKRPVCPRCNSKMVSVYMQKRTEGKIKNVKVGNYCQECRFIEAVEDE